MLFHTLVVQRSLWHALSGARISVLEIRSYLVITIKEIATIFFLIVLSFILWRLILFAQNQEDIFCSPTNLIAKTCEAPMHKKVMESLWQLMGNFRNVTEIRKTDKSKHIFLMFFLRVQGERVTDKRIVYFVKTNNVIFYTMKWIPQSINLIGIQFTAIFRVYVARILKI